MSAATYDQLMHLVRGRRSVRRFSRKPIARTVSERLIEAASWAPSAGNRQDWLFSVVESAALKKAMAEAVRRKWEEIAEENRDLASMEEVTQYAARFAEFELAPQVIVVSATKVRPVQQRLIGEAALATVGSFASAAMAAQNLMLAAHALGLSTCCMTGALAASAGLSQLLELGRRRELVCLIALGYPAEEPEAPERRPVIEIARLHE